jgi:Asp-tRNA(Asn)/Glu-tRNA(Gln) amidotransferase A subunit family amidase
MGDACSLVDEFRRGGRSPLEELQATYAAIDASMLNSFCYMPREQAFGGVPIGVKELDQVQGWPDTHASVPFRDDVADYTSVMVQRIRDIGGAILAGQTTASEFGGVNVTRTMLHGTTHNPWQHGRTPGGSSGGTAAAVSGGLVTIATGGDGGGSIPSPLASLASSD